jgi:hypothetical protein
MARGPDKRWAVEVDGLAKFQRDVSRTQPALKREVPQALRVAADRTVLPQARMNTPVGPGDRGRHMRDRWRVAATVSGAVLRNSDPGARTMEYGGRHPVFGRSSRLRRDGPAGRSVRRALGRADWAWVYQVPRGMARRAILSKADDLVRSTDAQLAVTFRRHGWETRR